MAKVTSSSNRSKRTSTKPVTKGQNPQRANRQKVSQAKVTSATNGKPTGSASARVTTGKGAAPAKPSNPARPSIGNVRGPGGRGKPASAQAKDTRTWNKLNQSASARAGKAAEPKPRTPAPGTGNVLKAAQQFSKDKAAKDRQINRNVAALRSQVNQSMVGKAATLVGGLRGGALKAVAETVAPRATAKGTLSAGGVQGPAMPKRLKEQGYAAQEKKARQRLEARKKATGSSSATPNTAESFDRAFKDARRAGVKTFTWRGKKYTTEMK